MKSLSTLIAIGILSAFIIGCEANARVGDDDEASRTTYKKTTTYDNGDRKVTTERKTVRDE